MPLQGLLLVLLLASCLLRDCATFCRLGDRRGPRILYRRHDVTTTRGILHSSQVDVAESAQQLPDDKEGNTGHYTTINRAAILDDEVDGVCDILGQALMQSQVLQHHTNDVLHDPTKPNLSRLFLDLQQSVYPQISTINNAGRGLFASRDFGRGEIVSLYPVHSVGVVIGDEFRAATSTDDQHYFEERSYETGYRINLIGNRLFPGGFKFDGTQQVPYIDTNPDNPDRPGWMAHLINDCATVSVNGENMAEKTILKYYETVSQRCNCLIVPFGPAPLCAAVTTQTVAKGEELFLSYGHKYWSAAERNILTERIQAAQDAVYDQIMAAMDAVEASYRQEALELGEIFDLLGKAVPA